jgi:hypothetical protein
VPIHRNVEGDRDFDWRLEADDGLRAGIGKPDRGDGAADKEQHCLHDELHDDLCPRRAERGANRQLASALDAAGQEHRRDVTARDEQDQRREAHEQRQEDVDAS